MSRAGILLVGGAGFIGGALARQLAAMGREVHVLAPHVDNGRHGGITFHRGEQSDAAVLRPLLLTCDTVVHLASATTPGASARAPALEMSANLVPAAAFLALLAEQSPRRLIFLSSGGTLYGNPSRLPADESLPIQSLSYYAAGKGALELFFGAFARQVPQTALAILRPSNVYGPGQPLRPGFGIVRTLLEKARAGGTIEIWGDGGQIRDFLYLDDFVDACLRLIDSPRVEGTFNAGSGQGVSLLALIGMIEKVTGRRIDTLAKPDRGVDVGAIYLDCQRLREAVQWAPAISIEEGVARTWAWMRGMSS